MGFLNNPKRGNQLKTSWRLNNPLWSDRTIHVTNRPKAAHHRWPVFAQRVPVVPPFTKFGGTRFPSRNHTGTVPFPFPTFPVLLRLIFKKAEPHHILFLISRQLFPAPRTWRMGSPEAIMERNCYTQPLTTTSTPPNYVNLGTNVSNLVN